MFQRDFDLLSDNFLQIMGVFKIWDVLCHGIDSNMTAQGQMRKEKMQFNINTILCQIDKAWLVLTTSLFVNLTQASSYLDRVEKQLRKSSYQSHP